MARDEYLQHLAAVPIFSECSKQQLQEIGRVADEIIVPAGTVLTRQGDVAFELFVLIEGTASVSRDGQLVATVTRGGFIGELAMLAQAPRNATVTADTQLTVLVLTAAGLGQLLDDIPGFAKHLLYEVAARLSPTQPDHSIVSEPVAPEPVAPVAPVPPEPVASQPVPPEPVAPEPVAPQAVAPEPEASQPVASEPVAQVATAPVSPEPVAQVPPDSVASEPVAPQPVAPEPVASEQVASEQVAAEPVASEPVAPQAVSSLESE